MFLLDEPLSNLDAQLRTTTRAELKRLQRELQITTLYVTHDQTEAMTLGDRIALLKHGALVQVGTPEDMYERPETHFAATFIGSPPMNLIPALAREQNGQTELTFGTTTMVLPPEKIDRVKLKKPHLVLGIRPEHVTLCSQGDRETLSGAVTTIEPLGRGTLIHVGTDCGEILVLSEERHVKVGETVHIFLDPNRVHAFASPEPG